MTAIFESDVFLAAIDVPRYPCRRNLSCPSPAWAYPNRGQARSCYSTRFGPPASRSIARRAGAWRRHIGRRQRQRDLRRRSRCAAASLRHGTWRRCERGRRLKRTTCHPDETAADEHEDIKFVRGYVARPLLRPRRIRCLSVPSVSRVFREGALSGAPPAREARAVAATFRYCDQMPARGPP